MNRGIKVLQTSPLAAWVRRHEKMERMMRFELTALAMARRCSTTEPHPHDGAQRWNRTTDTGIFSPLLYRLSYLGIKWRPERGSNP